MIQEALLELTTDIVTAHLGNNVVSHHEVPQLITAVYASLASLGDAPEAVVEEITPAVSVRSSVKADAITCLECGAKLKSLKRHLLASHGLSPEDYRARWNLKADYPMVCSDYAAKRQALALEIGLGTKGGRKPKAAKAVKAAKAAPKQQIAAETVPETVPETVAETENAPKAPAPKTRGRRKLGIKAG